MSFTRLAATILAGAFMSTAFAADPALDRRLDDAAADVEPKVVAWRRDFHEHPELGNREFRTAKIVADHLRALGIELRTRSRTPASSACSRAASPGPWWRCAPTWTRCR